jgi:hypothetical protein
LLNGNYLRSYVFEPAEAAQGFRQLIQMLLGLLPPNRVWGLDRIEQGLEVRIHWVIE